MRSLDPPTSNSCFSNFIISSSVSFKQSNRLLYCSSARKVPYITLKLSLLFFGNFGEITPLLSLGKQRSHHNSAWESSNHSQSQPRRISLCGQYSIFVSCRSDLETSAQEAHFHNRNTVQRNDNCFERSFLHFVKHIVKNSSRQLLEH